MGDNHRGVYPLPRTGWLRGEQPVCWVGVVLRSQGTSNRLFGNLIVCCPQEVHLIVQMLRSSMHHHNGLQCSHKPANVIWA